MKFEVEKPFLLRDNPDVAGVGRLLKVGEFINIAEKRAIAVRNLEADGFLQRVHADTKEK